VRPTQISRIHISLLIGFVLAAGVSFGVLVHRHTISVEQFDGFLGSAATFITTTCGPLHGVNKLSDWAKARPIQGNSQQ
jgi:hypothetical protein